MEYPVYLRMTETENVVAIQGPNRFWEGQVLGNRVLQHDVVCQTWPERQRVMDMLEPDGPWSKISKEAFDRVWSSGGAPPKLDVEEHVELAGVDHVWNFLEGQVVRPRGDVDAVA